MCSTIRETSRQSAPFRIGIQHTHVRDGVLLVIWRQVALTRSKVGNVGGAGSAWGCSRLHNRTMIPQRCGIHVTRTHLPPIPESASGACKLFVIGSLSGQLSSAERQKPWPNRTSGWSHASHRKTNSYTQTPPQRRPAHPRAPDGGRGRTAPQGHQGQPMGAPRRHNDPYGPPAWVSALPSLLICAGTKSTSSRRRWRSAGSRRGGACDDTPDPWRRVAAAEAAAARARAKITLDPRGNPLAGIGPRSPSGDSGFAYGPTGYPGSGLPNGHQWTPQSHLKA